jgi:asparagine synthetase B (glutamine-hydrolysing)
MRGSRRIGIFLSGGYDSRCIAASTRREHRPIPAITFGDPACRDVRFARQLTQELGLDHHVMTSECPYLYDLCPSIVWRTEGMLPFSMTTSPHHHDKIMQLADIILIGVLGDYNGAHTWPSLLLSRSREDTKNAIFSKRVATQIPLLKRVFRDGFFSRAFEALRQRFDQSFETLPNSHPLNVADSWYFMTLASPSAYFSPTVDRHKLETRMPLVDLDLVEFLLTIPPYARLEQRVYKKMIAYTFPCIRNVPCTNSALPVNPNFFDEYSRMIIRRLGRSIDSKIRDTFRMNKEIGRELGDDDQDFRNEPMLVDGYLKSLMRNDVLSSSIFNHDEIDRIIEMHYKKGESNWLIISQLITLGMAIKYILYSDLSDAPQSMYTS